MHRTDNDRLIHWLISGLELDTTLFHVGQYCGNWRASTSGKAPASFHVVLRGQCFLHLGDGDSVPLGPGDAVFLLRDLPHLLSPHADPAIACPPRPMLPMRPARPDGTSLACGFFHFRGLAAEMLVDSFPDYLLLRAGSKTALAVAPLFELLLAEADRDNAASPLIARLTELLFFYLVRDMAQHADVSAGLWAVARRPQFAALLDRLLHAPGQPWSVEEMARVAHMSRASFFKHFVDTCGQSPAQFLLSLRMHIAARRLRDGDSVSRAAEHVGYQSPAAFTRAFTRVVGKRPGAYRRDHHACQRGAVRDAGTSIAVPMAIDGPRPTLDDQARNGDACS